MLGWCDMAITTRAILVQAPSHVLGDSVEIVVRVPDQRPFVKAGAEFLDSWDDGWANDIDDEQLHMVDAQACVLGQLWIGRNLGPGYHSATRDLGWTGLQEQEYGFTLSTDVLAHQREHGTVTEQWLWEDLTGLWSDQIRQRQASEWAVIPETFYAYWEEAS